MRNQLERLDGRTYCYTGALDTDFGTSGVTRVSVPYAGKDADGAMTPTFMAVDANGRAVIGSMSRTGFTLRRVDAFGASDDAFAASAAGQPQAYGAQSNTSRLDVALDATNRIYVLNGTTVTRYRSNGQVDRSFGDKGRARLTAFKRTADLDVGADGHVFVVGSSGKGTGASSGITTGKGDQMRVLRLTADGKPDTTFAQDGVFTVPVPYTQQGDFNGSAAGQVVHAFPDGSVVFAGRGEHLYRDPDTGSEAVLNYHSIQSVRLDAKGRLVKTYGYRGIVTSDYIYNDAITSSDPNAVGVRSDGTVFVGNTFGTDNPDPDNAGGEDLRIIAPSGSTDFVKKPAFTTTTHGNFFDAWDGDTFFSNAEGLTKVNADGTGDAVFQAGGKVSAYTAAATANTGELLLAETAKPYDRYYNVSRKFLGSGPVATLVPATLTKSAKSLAFTVSYDNSDELFGVNEPKDGSELQIRGPGFSGSAVVTGTRRVDDKAKFGKLLVVSYTMTRAGGKRFTADQNGLYAVTLVGSRVTDANGTAAASGRIGTLVINIA